MNKQELIDAIFAQTGISKVQINKTIDALLVAIKKAVVKGDLVQLISFGSFKAGERAARTGRNPKTGEPIEIPTTRTVKFTPGKEFKEDLNRK